MLGERYYFHMEGSTRDELEVGMLMQDDFCVVEGKLNTHTQKSPRMGA